MKKTYIAPILNIDDVEVSSMLALSIQATISSTDTFIYYGDNTDSETIDFMD